jgi:hypothetical protein
MLYFLHDYREGVLIAERALTNDRGVKWGICSIFAVPVQYILSRLACQEISLGHPTPHGNDAMIPGQAAFPLLTLLNINELDLIASSAPRHTNGLTS